MSCFHLVFLFAFDVFDLLSFGFLFAFIWIVFGLVCSTDLGLHARDGVASVRPQVSTNQSLPRTAHLTQLAGARDWVILDRHLRS
jgi:hypothetical protein